MAFCPKCNSEIGAKDVRCQDCGYDFSASDTGVTRQGWEHSSFADAILVSGAFVLIVGFLACLLFLVASLVERKPLYALYSVLVANIALALFIVVVRSVKN